MVETGSPAPVFESFPPPTPTERFRQKRKSVFAAETVNQQYAERKELTQVPERAFAMRQKLIDEGIFSSKKSTIFNQHYEVPFKEQFEDLMGGNKLLSQLSKDIGTLKKTNKSKPVSYINEVTQHLSMKADERRIEKQKQAEAEAKEKAAQEVSPENPTALDKTAEEQPAEQKQKEEEIFINPEPISTDFSVDVYFPRDGDEDDLRIRFNANANGKLENIVLIYSQKNKPEENLPIPGLNTANPSDSVARRELIVAQILTPEEAEEQLPAIMEQLEKNKYRVGDIKWKWNKGLSLLKRTRTRQARINDSKVTLLQGIQTHPSFCKIDATDATQLLVDTTTPRESRITPIQLMAHLRQYQPEIINADQINAAEEAGDAMERATPLPMYQFYGLYEHLAELFPRAEAINDLAFELEFNDERMKPVALAVKKWLDQVHSLPLDITRSADKGSNITTLPVIDKHVEQEIAA